MPRQIPNADGRGDEYSYLSPSTFSVLKLGRWEFAWFVGQASGKILVRYCKSYRKWSHRKAKTARYKGIHIKLNLENMNLNCYKYWQPCTSCFIPIKMSVFLSVKLGSLTVTFTLNVTVFCLPYHQCKMKYKIYLLFWLSTVTNQPFQIFMSKNNH
jgi:hypothetical protein